MTDEVLSSDVQRLFDSIGSPGFEFREVAAQERWQAAAQRWPLLVQTNKLVLDRQLSEVPCERKPRQPVGRCTTIAMVSLHGGAGRTTLAANLAVALGQNGRAAVAADLDPQNSLALHFGLESTEALGLCLSTPSRDQLSLWWTRFRGGAGVLPFGSVPSAQASTLEQAIGRDPTWIQRRLEQMLPPETEFLILDTPARSSPWLKQALAIADLVLLVILPDGAAYSTLPATESLFSDCQLGKEGRRRSRYIVNRFDARRALDRDVLASLRGMMPDRALARPVHEDEVAREALAKRKFIVREGPHSQVVAEIARLAEWAELGATEFRDAQAEPVDTLVEATSG